MYPHNSAAYSQHTPQVLDGDGSLCVLEYVQQHPRPVAAVAELSQVREGFLRGAERLVQLGELIAEGDEELAVSLALVGWQGEDAGHVIALRTLLLLRNKQNQTLNHV